MVAVARAGWLLGAVHCFPHLAHDPPETHGHTEIPTAGGHAEGDQQHSTTAKAIHRSNSLTAGGDAWGDQQNGHASDPPMHVYTLQQSLAATASPLAGTPGVTSSMDMLPPRSRRCILAARWMRLEKNLQGNKVVVACY